jgi:hypothetical protein
LLRYYIASLLYFFPRTGFLAFWAVTFFSLFSRFQPVQKTAFWTGSEKPKAQALPIRVLPLIVVLLPLRRRHVALGIGDIVCKLFQQVIWDPVRFASEEVLR